MQTHMLKLEAMLIVVVIAAVVVCWLTPTMAADEAANVAQVDLVND
jgi:hypothetical protein